MISYGHAMMVALVIVIAVVVTIVVILLGLEAKPIFRLLSVLAFVTVGWGPKGYEKERIVLVRWDSISGGCEEFGAFTKKNCR
jgi:hypothetical protein